MTSQRWPLSLTLMVLLGACTAPRITNPEPARQLARETQLAPGALYAGWRIYQQRCAQCHGQTAEGLGGAGPNLLQRVGAMGPQRFVEQVLRRYPEGLPASATAAEVLARRQGLLTMPSWQGDPVVEAHLMDLYTYLAGRADGRIGPQPPAR
ncbi:mono/diheme cytochrome c family protein [Inhella inkyongensis]|uniref:Mono/diheme cytochrome c family protein n=1 Tax=Inhella inkyongensis TaxID=392593 RepID=A0A840S0G0_9BURK|nr:cytochrome c [Inhella inkyongensis]MBB5202992.1 mono/diheme cytochrome c family protein [Inhella inkyongensis]